MKALILVGGFGTRLRPLTFSVPKPLVEFANKPIVCHQIEALVEAGVKEVILAINYQPQVMMDSLKKYEEKFGIKIICSQEYEPMGTAGPIRLAKDILLKDNKEGMFFVFNSDVICEFPLKDMIAFHKAHGKEGTIMVTQVEDPSKYGVVVSNEKHEIEKFIEKPTTYVSNKINAGLYLLNTAVIDRIEERPTSIEKEIFPKMAADQQLCSMLLPGFWMDIGQPKDFIHGMSLYLNFVEQKKNELLHKDDNILGNVIVHSSAKVHKDAVIGPNVTIGENCVIEEGVRLSNTCVFSNVQIKAHTWIQNSIIGWQTKVGKWVRIEGMSVVAEDVQIKDEVYINGSFILPHKTITANLPNAGTIVM